METILITGSAGFIGFHVAKKLLAQGKKVIGVDNFNDSYDVQVKKDRNKILESHDNFILYKEDITNYEAMLKIMTEHRIDKICHLAARAGVLPSLKDPFIYEKTNILGTLNIFEAAKQKGVKHIVAASSSSVYGKNKNYPSSETDEVNTPISLYAATKKSTELIAHTYNHLFDINITMLRFFNVYGEWGRPDMMAWIFVENIINGQSINVNNNGDTWKDYTYIDDIANGVIKSLEKPLGYQVINLGNNTPEHLKKCIEVIEKITGKKAIMEMKPMQPGDVVKSCASTKKAKELLGWEPTTKIEVGLKNFITWYKEYKKKNND